MYAGLKFTQIQTEMQSRQQHTAKANLYQMFEVIPDELCFYHFYNSNNPLQEEFNNEQGKYIKAAASKACAQTCSIDLLDLEKSDERLVELATGKTIKELMDSNTPTIVYKSNLSFKVVSNLSEFTLDDFYNVAKNRKCKHVTSLIQFSEYLKCNKNLNDNVVALYLPVQEGEDASKAIQDFEDQHVIPLNFMRGETDHILIITDKELATN